MNLIQKIKNWYDEFEAKQTIRVGGTGMAMNFGNWVGSSSPGNVYSNWYNGMGWYSGTRIDYAGRVGPLYNNSAYMACLAAYQDAFSQAPICIKQMQAEGGKVILPDHELMELFELVNTDDDAITLIDATLVDYIGKGNAYWRMDGLDRVGNPHVLHSIPEQKIKPVTAESLGRVPQPGEPAILWYEYFPTSAPERIEREEIVHIRLGKNPQAPHMGLGRGDVLLREIFADNEATNYTSSTLYQMGIAQRILQPRTYKDGDKEMVAPFNGEQIATMLMQASTGDNRGATVAIESLFDIHESDVTPEKMALDVVRKYPESRVSAVTRVPAMVAGLLSGEGTRTYSNYEEAREAFWQDSVLPNMRRIRSQVTRQLIWRNQKYKARKIWFGFNYDEVPALQVDEQARDKNIRENFKYGLLDAKESREMMGLKPNPGDEGRMYKPNAGKEDEDPEEARIAAMVDGKGSFISRLSAELEQLESRNGHHEEVEA